MLAGLHELLRKWEEGQHRQLDGTREATLLSFSHEPSLEEVLEQLSA